MLMLKIVVSCHLESTAEIRLCLPLPRLKRDETLKVVDINCAYGSYFGAQSAWRGQEGKDIGVC